MAVDARHLNFFNTATEANMNPYNGGYGLLPLSGTTTESFLPIYNGTSAAVAGFADTFPAKVAVKTESDLNNAYNLPVSRKRPREGMNQVMTCQTQNGNRCGSFMFLGEDLSLQMQQQQFEMDRLITQHNNEVRREIEERRKSYSRRIVAAVEQGVVKRLKSKDEEIDKIRKLNWALQEKVKSLSVEGQIWRDLAHTNEATAHTLRANLEQVLATQLENDDQGADVAVLADDADSSCGSNYREYDQGEECGTRGGERKCKHCGEGESSVLMLPCRHLCLCTACGSSVHTCPVCNTPKNTSVNVIIS